MHLRHRQHCSPTYSRTNGSDIGQNITPAGCHYHTIAIANFIGLLRSPLQNAGEYSKMSFKFSELYTLEESSSFRISQPEIAQVPVPLYSGHVTIVVVCCVICCAM
jgi:hypothetical protein